jgi:hypothetical protein
MCADKPLHGSHTRGVSAIRHVIADSAPRYCCVAVEVFCRAFIPPVSAAARFAADPLAAPPLALLDF